MRILRRLADIGITDRSFSESPWPGNAPFAVALTHDVDRVRKTYQYVTHLRRREGWRNLRSFIDRENPYWNFERIKQLEASHGVKSTFYFLEESRRFSPREARSLALQAGRYRFDDESVAGAIRDLDRTGWEVGLHGSFDSFRRQELLRREKLRLEDVLGHEVGGVRQHYLNLDIPRTWEFQQKAGFVYDASLGHRESVGFSDLPHFPFSPLRNAFVVLPLVIMDGALQAEHKSSPRARAAIEKIIEEARATHALMVILWHQRFLNQREFPQHWNAYSQLLQSTRKAGAWTAPARDIVAWWNKHHLGG